MVIFILFTYKFRVIVVLLKTWSLKPDFSGFEY